MAERSEAGGTDGTGRGSGVEPVEFDPFSDVFFDDPLEMYARLRDEAPVYHSERYGFYALSRFDDVCEAHRDWPTFSSAFGTDLNFLTQHSREAVPPMILFMDPPEHDRLRALVSRVFTPRAMTELGPMIAEVIAGFAEALDGRDAFDAVAEFSALFPVEIISRMLGVPAGDRQMIRESLDLSLHREPGEMRPSAEGTAAAIAMGTYFYELTVEKRRHPGDDMISRLTTVEVERGDGSATGLDDVEIAGFASLLGGAGAETVTKLVGNAVVLFARNPEQWTKVLDDTDRIPAAVEEILRYHPPSQYQGRYTLVDTERHGVTIPAGEPVLLVTGAATHDPRAYDEPDRFDIDRPPSLSLGFGYGIHSCLGAALARTESRLAIAEIARRWPRHEVDEDGLRRVHMSNVAGYSNVPVLVTG
ncbi:MAG: cytochrome P450 [Acidimicrobiales bacterium]|jgi:cytochrome P450|nr:cytochrome P450 [Acidimicrobiales bacterium]